MRRAPALMLGGAVFAFAELVAGLLLSDFAVLGGVKPSHFLVARPWLLLVLALVTAHLRVAARWPLYLAAIGLASAAEATLLWALGGGVSPTVARSAAAGLVLVLVLDLAAQLGRVASVRSRWWLPAALASGALMLPGPIRWFDMIARGTVAPPAAPQRVALLSGLPLTAGARGTTGLAPPGPIAAVRLLEQRFSVRDIAAVTPDSVPSRDVLVVIQPRTASAYDLAALDRWVQGGGRALFLLDPTPRWPRPSTGPKAAVVAATAPLEPLLDHWGLKLTAPKKVPAAPVDHSLQVGDRAFRVRVDAPGAFLATDGRCRILDRALVADCVLGRGEAVLLADVDLLRDELWVGDGLAGVTGEARLADNGPYLVRRIEDLAGIPPASPSGERAEALPMNSHRAALLLALALVFGCFALGLLGLASAGRRRGSSPAR